jgi:hypothetical protein
MVDLTGQSRSLSCPRCRRPASLRLRSKLQEADRFPEVHCLECWACGEVVIVEWGLRRRTEAAQEIAVRFAA